MSLLQRNRIERAVSPLSLCLAARSYSLSAGGLGRFAWEMQSRLVDRGHKVVCHRSPGEGLGSYFRYSFGSLVQELPPGYDAYHALTPMESVWMPKDRAVVTVLDLIPITNLSSAGARIGGRSVVSRIGQGCFIAGALQAMRCRHIVCISEKTRLEVYQHLRPEGTVHVIRLGIHDELAPAPNDDGVLRFGYLGQLDRRKRLHLLIEAFCHSSIDAELVLGGVGLERDRLVALAGGDPRIRFLGFIPDADIPSFYQHLDCLIFPTAVEGYGLPLVEAMACGKPAVVLSDSLVPYEVKRHCSIVDHIDDVFTPGTLQSIVGDFPRRQESLEFARQHQWDSCIDQYESLYREVEGDR